jgi:hypothetical protein
VCVCVFMSTRRLRESVCVCVFMSCTAVCGLGAKRDTTVSLPHSSPHMFVRVLSPVPLAPEPVRSWSHSRGPPPWPACAATSLQEACVMSRLCTYRRQKCTHGRLSEARMQTPTCSVDVKCELLQTSHMHRVLRSVPEHFSFRAPEFARAPARPNA